MILLVVIVAASAIIIISSSSPPARPTQLTPSQLEQVCAAAGGQYDRNQNICLRPGGVPEQGTICSGSAPVKVGQACMTTQAACTVGYTQYCTSAGSSTGTEICTLGAVRNEIKCANGATQHYEQCLDVAGKPRQWYSYDSNCQSGGASPSTPTGTPSGCALRDVQCLLGQTVQWFSTATTSLVPGATNVASSAVNTITSIPQTLIDTGQQAVSWIWNGSASLWNTASSTVQNAASSLNTAACENTLINWLYGLGGTCS
jgi:hypothetical protein